MASQADIANLALTILGKPTIASLTDNSMAAQTINAVYDTVRRALLTGPATWRVSVSRATLPELASAPVAGPFTTQFALPSDYLRILQVGDNWPGLDLSDYRLGPTDTDYSIEEGILLC